MSWTVPVAFLAGGVTTLSPCVLPLLPILLSTGLQQGRLRPLGVALGFIGAFSATTLALSAAVRVLGVPPDIHRSASVVLLVLFGLILAVPALGHRFELWSARLLPSPSGPPAQGLLGGLALGAALGLAWTPCVGPIMAAVITLALNEQVTAGAVAITLAFAAGSAIPMAALVLGGQSMSRRLRWFQRHATALRTGMGILLLATAAALFIGADRQIQSLLLQWFPAWETALTGWEPKP